MAKPIMIYAWYKGDDFLFEGTIQDFADRMNVGLDYARIITTPSYRKRAVYYESMMFKVPLAKVVNGEVIEL